MSKEGGIEENSQDLAEPNGGVRTCQYCHVTPAAHGRWECYGCKTDRARKKKLHITQSEREKELSRKLEEMTLSRNSWRKTALTSHCTTCSGQDDICFKVQTNSEPSDTPVQRDESYESYGSQCRGCLEDQPNQLAHCDPLTGCLADLSIKALQDSISSLTLSGRPLSFSEDSSEGRSSKDQIEDPQALRNHPDSSQGLLEAERFLTITHDPSIKKSSIAPTKPNKKWSKEYCKDCELRVYKRGPKPKEEICLCKKS